METTMTKDLAMTAVREICARPRRGANTAHAGTPGSVQGRTVSFAGFIARDVLGTDVRGTGVDGTGVDGTAPVTGVVYPRLEAPPV